MALDIGGIREQKEHAFIARFGKYFFVKLLPVKRRGIDLEITGVDDFSHWGIDQKSGSIHDAVIDRSRGHSEMLERDPVSHLESPDIRRILEPVFPKPIFDQKRRKSRGINR